MKHIVKASVKTYSQNTSHAINKLGLSVICCLSLAVSINAANAESMMADTQPCPSDFNNVKIPSDGKFCQVFAGDFPASMIMHVPQAPASVVEYYAADYPLVKEVKARTLMQTADKNTTLVISADGDGTQVDILVKSI